MAAQRAKIHRQSSLESAVVASKAFIRFLRFETRETESIERSRDNVGNTLAEQVPRAFKNGVSAFAEASVLSAGSWFSRFPSIAR